MRIKRAVTAAVSHDDRFAIACFRADKTYHAATCAFDGRAVRCSVIHAQMRAVFFEYGVIACAGKMRANAREFHGRDEQKALHFLAARVKIAVLVEKHLVGFLLTSMVAIFSTMSPNRCPIRSLRS